MGWAGMRDQERCVQHRSAGAERSVCKLAAHKESERRRSGLHGGMRARQSGNKSDPFGSIGCGDQRFGSKANGGGNWPIGLRFEESSIHSLRLPIVLSTNEKSEKSLVGGTINVGEE